MSLGPLYVLLREVSVQVLCPFFNWLVCLPGVESCEFFIYFRDQTVVQGIIGKYIFPYSWFLFHFSDVFFICGESFHFEFFSFKKNRVTELDYKREKTLEMRLRRGRAQAIWALLVEVRIWILFCSHEESLECCEQ